MSMCDRLLDRIPEALRGELPPDLAEHLAGCSGCRRAVERTRGLAEASRVFALLEAPVGLTSQIKSMTRFAVACDSVLDKYTDALDGTLPAEATDAFLDHLQACTRCRHVWESMATLREIGHATVAPGSLTAATGLPPWQRVDVRRRRSFLPDLKLATAAAYLLASLAVVLVGNPSSLAREGAATMEKATVFARAAVENRIDSFSDRLLERAVTTRDWVVERAQATWEEVEGWFTENPKRKNDVAEDDDRRSS